jgi:polyhydroxyalkanoate synthesis repressor PhaR
MSPPVLIKKYGNRRLYDTQESRYITLEELALKVRAGSDVRVIDAQKGDDLTQATLAQLILESGTAARVLPVGLLTQLVRLGDDALAEFFSRYVTTALDIYLQAKRGIQSLSPFNPMSQLPMAEALSRMWGSSPFAGYGSAPPGYPPPQASAPPPPPDAEPPSHDRDDVATLRREIDELKRSLRADGASVGKPGAKRRPRRGTP